MTPCHDVSFSEIKDCAISDGLQSKTVTKAQKISRAMQAYMERARSYGNIKFLNLLLVKKYFLK